MAEMPAAIGVGPYRFSVELDQAAIDEATRKHSANGQPFLGHTDFAAQRMILSPTLAADARAETLLHECLHALFDQSHGFELKDDLQERIIHVLGFGLLDVLRRNPELVAYLVDTDD